MQVWINEDKMMWYVKDIKKDKVYPTECIPTFYESYEHPENLIIPDIYYTDGSGWNGKRSRISIYRINSVGEVFKMIENYDRNMTNNEAEYRALFEALILSKEHDIILTDSQLVQRQMEGTYRIHAENLKHMHNTCNILARRLKTTIIWIPREQNLAGKELERIR